MNLTSRNIAFFCGYPTSDAWNLDRRRYDWDHFILVNTIQSAHRYNLFHAALAQVQYRLGHFGAGPSQMLGLLSRIDQQALFDRLRAESVVVRAGARTIPLTSDNQSIAKLASDPTPAFRAEAGAISESDPTFTTCISEQVRQQEVINDLIRNTSETLKVNQVLSTTLLFRSLLECDSNASNLFSNL